MHLLTFFFRFFLFLLCFEDDQFIKKHLNHNPVQELSFKIILKSLLHIQTVTWVLRTNSTKFHSFLGNVYFSSQFLCSKHKQSVVKSHKFAGMLEFPHAIWKFQTCLSRVWALLTKWLHYFHVSNWVSEWLSARVHIMFSIMWQQRSSLSECKCTFLFQDWYWPIFHLVLLHYTYTG